MRALCLVRFSGKRPEKVLEEIKKIKGVQDAFFTFGRFDAVILLTATDLAGGKSIGKAIQSNPGIKRTETLIEV
jgi:DNA-binding Lrp family transcriptional regulator